MNENNESIVDSRIYEISFIFDNKLDEETALKKRDALKQSIATLGGSFISEEAPYMRELAYEMVRVQNNTNVRFNEGYFGWIKFEMDGERLKELDKSLRLDEEVVRYLIVKTVRENTVWTKKQPTVHVEDLANNPVDGQIDTTTEEIPLEEIALPKEDAVAGEVK